MAVAIVEHVPETGKEDSDLNVLKESEPSSKNMSNAIVRSGMAVADSSEHLGIGSRRAAISGALQRG